jgi:acyl carrier protein
MKTQQEIYDFHTIKTEIKGYILANFLPGDDEQSLQDNDLLFESGIIDSAGAMTFISFLEDHFGIEVLDEELFPENFASVTHIVNFVTGKLEKQ